MKKQIFVFCFLILLTGCQKTQTQVSTTSLATNETIVEKESVKTEQSIMSGAYKEISQEEAKKFMDSEEPVIILDVRTYEEYEDGHIEGAMCIPVENINENSKAQIEMLFTNKEQTILVYCRSGNRSKAAAQKLADMGYINVKEFGGIINWQYGTVSE